MQQGLLCNDMGLPGMGQQPGHGQLPYGHAGLDPSLAASMANLGLQGSLMDSLQSSHWQVGAHTFCECLILSGQKEGTPRQQPLCSQSTAAVPDAMACSRFCVGAMRRILQLAQESASMSLSHGLKLSAGVWLGPPCFVEISLPHTP
jgi:hypothetical protein